MFQYSVDHQGRYPVGHSSTEIFQQLIDQKYITDAALLYAQLPGKTAAKSGKLRPENVSWDVTVPVESASSDDTPVVFLTGYRINYQPGGSAVPLFKSHEDCLGGLPVCYHSNNAWFKTENPRKSNHVVEDFVPAAFRVNGQKFQQLTPDGPLPPP